MKKILFLVLAFCSFNSLHAQNTDADIKEIKNYYYKLKDNMKEASTAEYPPYYVVKTEENVLKKSMPAVGDYYGTTEYWYEDGEEGESGKDGVLVYKKSDFQIAARKEFSEYVFQEGKLIFCFIKTAGAEYRYYFKNDKLISFADKAGEEDYDFYKKEDAQYLLENAKK